MLQVAAAILQRDSRVLICRRAEGGNCGGLWEFPGGKLEPGETPTQAVCRECLEELGVTVAAQALFDSYIYSYPDVTIEFYFYKSVILQGEPEARVHTEIVWEEIHNLKNYEFCPADTALVQRLMCRKDCACSKHKT